MWMSQRKNIDKLRRIIAYTNTDKPITLTTIDVSSKTLTCQSLKPMSAWYKYAATHEDEMRFMCGIGVDKFAALN